MLRRSASAQANRLRESPCGTEANTVPSWHASLEFCSRLFHRNARCSGAAGTHPAQPVPNMLQRHSHLPVGPSTANGGAMWPGLTPRVPGRRMHVRSPMPCCHTHRQHACTSASGSSPVPPPRPSTPRTDAPRISARVGAWRVRSATSQGHGLAQYGCVELWRLARAADQRGLLVRSRCVGATSLLQVTSRGCIRIPTPGPITPAPCIPL